MKPNNRIKAYCSSNSIKAIDAFEYFKKYYDSKKDSLYYFHDEHLNERGQALLAQIVEDSIR